MSRSPYRVTKDGVTLAVPLDDEAQKVLRDVDVLQKHTDAHYKAVPEAQVNRQVQKTLVDAQTVNIEKIVRELAGSHADLLSSNPDEFDRLVDQRVNEQRKLHHEQKRIEWDSRKKQEQLVKRGAGKPYHDIIPGEAELELMRQGKRIAPARLRNWAKDTHWENVMGEEKSLVGATWDAIKSVGKSANLATIPLNVTSAVNIPRVRDNIIAERLRDGQMPYDMESYADLLDEIEKVSETKTTVATPPVPMSAGSMDFMPMSDTMEVKGRVQPRTKLGTRKEAWEGADEKVKKGATGQAAKSVLGSGFFGEGQASDFDIKANEVLHRNAQQLAQELQAAGLERDLGELTGEIYGHLMQAEEHSGRLQHPVIAQMGPEFVADALMPWNTIAKGVGKGIKAAKKVPGIKQADQVAGKIFDPHQVSRPDNIRGIPEESVARISDAEIAAQSKGVAAESRLKEFESKLADLSRKLSPEGNALYAQIDDAGDAVAKINLYNKMTPKDKSLFNEIVHLNSELYDFKKSTGMLMEEGADGVIRSAAMVEGYMPRYAKHRTFTGEGNDAVVNLPGRKTRSGATEVQIDPKSGHSRVGTSRAEGGFTDDAAVQWRAAASVEGREAKIASIVQDLAPAYAREGLVYADDVTGLPATVKAISPEEGMNITQTLAKQTGDEWVALGPDLSRMWRNALIGEGGNVSNATIFAPRHAAEYFEAVIPALPAQLKGDFAGGVQRGIDTYMSHWKGMKTMAGMAGFAMTNVYGSAQLALAGQGAKFFNPQVQAAAMKVAIDAAFRGQLKGVKGSFTLRSGETVPTQQLAKIMQEYGVTGQGGARLGRRPGESLSPLESFFDVTGMTQAVRGTDDWFHATAFLNSLESLHPQDIFKAVRLANEQTGNYRLMTPTEKLLSKNLLPFYGFQGYAAKFFLRESLTQPSQPLRQMGNIYQSYEKDASQKKPLGYEARKDWTEAMITSPQQLKDGASDEVVMMRTDPPWTGMADLAPSSPLLNFIAAVTSGVDPDTGHPTQELKETAFRMYDTLMEDLANGLPMDERLQTVLFEGTRNPVFKVMLDPLMTPSRGLLSMYQVWVREYGQEEAQNRIAAVYVSNLMAGMDGVIRKAGRMAGLKIPKGVMDENILGLDTFPGQPRITIEEGNKQLMQKSRQLNR